MRATVQSNLFLPCLCSALKACCELCCDCEQKVHGCCLTATKAVLLTVTAEHFKACCASAGNVAYAHMCADLQVFIDSKYKLAYNGRYTTDEEITGMLIAVLFAGQHTSSVTCTWTLLSMLANQVRGSTLQPAAPHVCPAAAPCNANYTAVGHKCNQLHVC